MTTIVAFALCSLLFVIFISLPTEISADDKDSLSYGADLCSKAMCRNGDCFLFANKTGVVCSCPINKTGPDCSKESLSCYKCRKKARKDCIVLPDGTARCICTYPRKPAEICYFPKLVENRQKLCLEGKHDCDLNEQCVNYGRYPGSVLLTCLCRSGDRRGESCIDRYNHIEPGEVTSCVGIPGQDPICICKKYGIDPGFCKPIKNMDNDTEVYGAVWQSSNTTASLSQVTAGSNPGLTVPKQTPGESNTVNKRVRRHANCPTLSYPENGRVAVEGYNPGNIAAYTCKTGYTLSGSNYQTCQNDYTWSLQPPTCVDKSKPSKTSTPSVKEEPISNRHKSLPAQNTPPPVKSEKPIVNRKCPPFNQPVNGRVTVEGYDPGSLAAYTCNNGYRLSGTNYQTCQKDYTWSPQPPTCVEKPLPAHNSAPSVKSEKQKAYRICPPLDDPLNGRVTAKDYSPGNVAAYTCKTGYTLSGSNYLTCQNDYTWSSQPPTCVEKSAPVPTPSPTVKKEEPTANRKCPSLHHPENGRLAVEGYSPGNIAAYTCNNGYRLNGASYQTCQSDFSWSLQPPTCVAKSLPVSTASPSVKKEEPIANRKCPPLNHPDNGRVAVEGYDPGNIAAFTCKTGYSLIGANYQKCQNDFTWSLHSPTCVEKITPAPTPPPTVKLEETTVKPQCPSLNHPDNGRVAIEGNEPGNVAAYTCKTGYSLIGANYQKCQNDFTWSLQPPTCVEKSQPIPIPLMAKSEEASVNLQCPTLNHPENGRVAVEGYNPGNIASYTCKSGYRMNGANYRKCQNDYNWSLHEPICVEILPPTSAPSSTAGLEDLTAKPIVECPSLSDPENGRVAAEGYNPGNVADYTCKDEYRLSGAKYRKCQHDGTWSLDPPTCIHVPQPALPELQASAKSGAEEKKSTNSNTDTVLIVVSCVVVVLILVILFFLFRKKRAEKNKEDIETTALMTNQDINPDDEIVELKRDDLNDNWPLHRVGERRLPRGYGRIRTYSAPYSESITKLNSASHNSRDQQRLKQNYLREILKRQGNFPYDRPRVKRISSHGLEVLNGNAECMPRTREYFDDNSKIDKRRVYYCKRSKSSVR